MTGFGRETGIDAAESGCLSFGSVRESENTADGGRGFPNVGFRICRIVNRIGYNARRGRKFSQFQRVSRPCIPSHVGP